MYVYKYVHIYSIYYAQDVRQFTTKPWYTGRLDETKQKIPLLFCEPHKI